MRVLHAIQELRGGGAERVVVSLARGAERYGHDVAVAAAPGPLAAELSRDPFPLPILDRRPWRVPAAARALGGALREFRPDLVHVHNPGIAAAAGLATRRGTRTRGLVSFHGTPERDYAAAARVLRLSGLPVVACGPGVAAALDAHGCRARATVLNGVGPAPPPADPDRAREELGVPPGHSLVVAVGRLTPQKNFALAVRAVAGLPGVALAILGEGPLRDELAAEARRLGVADRVVLAGFRPDARELLGAADAVVAPSTWEGLPLALLEALAAGTPLVATAVRGIRELVEHERHALLVPTGDELALRAALERVLADPALAGSLAAAGRAIAAAHSEERMVRDYLTLYETMIGE